MTTEFNPGAAGDLNEAVKLRYEANTDTNAYTDTEKAKLAAIEASATADQTGAEIKIAYESEGDTNAFTDALLSKVNGIEASATADQTPSEIAAMSQDWRGQGNETLITATAALEAAASAGVSDGDKGDITVSSSGAVWTIDDESITLAKMAHMATASLLGRSTGGTGDPEVLSATQVRTLLNIEDGATADQSNSEIETAYNTQVGQVSSGEKTAGTETAVRRFAPQDIRDMIDTHGGAGGGDAWGDLVDADIIPDADSTRDLGNTSTRFKDGFIDDLTVTTTLTLGGDDVLTDGNIDTLTAVTSVGADELVFGDTSDSGNAKKTTITNFISDHGLGGLSDGDKGDITVSASGATWTIDNSAVTLAKMADMATDSFLGRDTAGTGAPEVLSASAVRTILNVEDGADVTDTANVTSAGALMDSEMTDLAGVKALDTSTLALLGANVFTGTQDFNGQQVEGMLNKVVPTVTGTLTTTAHSGNVLETSGNVTVPTTAGFNCVLIAGGAHTVTFNSTTSAAMAAGDLMTLIVKDATTIHAVLTAATDKVSFT